MKQRLPPPVSMDPQGAPKGERDSLPALPALRSLVSDQRETIRDQGRLEVGQRTFTPPFGLKRRDCLLAIVNTTRTAKLTEFVGKQRLNRRRIATYIGLEETLFKSSKRLLDRAQGMTAKQ